MDVMIPSRGDPKLSMKLAPEHPSIGLYLLYLPALLYLPYLTCTSSVHPDLLPNCYSGTDMDGDGSPDWALCLDLLPPCKSNALLMGIASSIMQTTGASQVCSMEAEPVGCGCQGLSLY